MASPHHCMSLKRVGCDSPSPWSVTNRIHHIWLVHRKSRITKRLTLTLFRPLLIDYFTALLGRGQGANRGGEYNGGYL